MSEARLPPGFEELAPWLDWSLGNMDARRDCRINSTMSELEGFYDVMLRYLNAILAHLAEIDVEHLDARSEILLNMTLTLAEVAPAVEQFFEPEISYGYDVTRFTQGVR